ncbi:type II toxin-antitoxin system PemK/MazF family toxin [Bacteroides sp. Phil13]|uniref:type II toxin-antitoxin system PemK/MazF family toxin n=1 Tax=Bacteroides sp. Phil13 TaxID=1929999 RepID=UPI000AA73BFB|nr:type II toxin-antitoxin system PemK/MazF family toxin [Bacteroides sp. Phil13]
MNTSEVVKRGEIYRLKWFNNSGSEQEGNRPVVIVSNNKGNANSPLVTYVALTTQTKTPLPTHVTLTNKYLRDESTALCEHPYSVTKGKLDDYIGRCTDEEMQQIDNALLIALELCNKQPESHNEVVQSPYVDGEDENYIIKQLNDRIQKLREVGTSLSSVEQELTKIAKADITLGGVSNDYLTEELKNEIRAKASEKMEARKSTLENEILSLLEPKKIEQPKPIIETKVEKPISNAKTSSDRTLEKAEKELDFEEVRKKYVDENYNMGDLGRYFHKAPATMSAYLKAHGINKPRGGNNRKPR